jgi:hypothetical protein
MPTIRVASANLEWMNDWFTPDANPVGWVTTFKRDNHAQHEVPANDRYTAIFDDFVEKVSKQKLLLDHILLSPGLDRPTGLRAVAGSGTIHHTEYDNQVVSGGKKRENRPSDHRPVSVQLKY